MSLIVIAQIIIAILLTGAVLMQSQGTGLGSWAGGSDSYHTRRGVEKVVYYATIVLAALFTVVSIVALL